MSTSSTAYKQLAIPYFKEVFTIIDRVMKDLSVPYYLIGVNAMALELLQKGIKPMRGTKDIDFAVMVSTISEYDDLINSLTTHGFNKVKAPWTLYHKEFNVAIDLLPFGEIEEKDTLLFNQRYSDLHILGFSEILESAHSIQIEEIQVAIPPIPGMVLLKLVAWSDRPEERDNDLADIIYVIKHYYDYEWDTITDEHSELLLADPLDELMVSARVLGRMAKTYLSKSALLSQRIFTTLESNLTDIGRSAIAKDWATGGVLTEEKSTAEYAIRLLSELEKGLKE